MLYQLRTKQVQMSIDQTLRVLCPLPVTMHLSLFLFHWASFGMVPCSMFPWDRLHPFVDCVVGLLTLNMNRVSTHTLRNLPSPSLFLACYPPPTFWCGFWLVGQSFHRLSSLFFCSRAGVLRWAQQLSPPCRHPSHAGES